jgi:hypothetical protein
VPQLTSPRVKKNELKQYIEAKMGTYVDNSRRAGFLKHGHNCLMFVCSWDDTQVMLQCLVT